MPPWVAQLSGRPHLSFVLDLASADVNPLARLMRPPGESESFRSLELVVVERAGHNLFGKGVNITS